ncbi:abscisic acid receptor PYL10-like [Amaranthus tricolor]|uniref:abscisic acid receptor PYL10-like n=1 Tax=Amaranthus tricolor TaxID=29722 RepID=UPI002587953C|nr:abscisic acid receptor PYL10-like [Amaranthus tricolor]
METESEFINKYHMQLDVGANQCSSILTKHIKAPVHIVWSLVRRFDQPQKYKPFVSECILTGDFKVGTVREVNVRSGLPATTSTEILELLDDEQHIFGVRIMGGDHRLRNYTSKITVHPEKIDGKPGTLLIESFVVDIPDGNTREETYCFVQSLINCNHNCLAEVSEKMALHSGNSGQNNPAED